MGFEKTTKTIVIGGTSGIGRAVAELLSARPGEVVVASRSNGLDISDEDQVNEFFKRQGLFDHLVVTAGSRAPSGKLVGLNLNSARSAFDTKFWGSVNAVHAAASNIRPGGTITLTSGFLARRTVPGTFVKTAMNAALEATAKILARELAPLRVNVVSPGLTETEAYSGMEATARSQMLQNAAASLPAGRVAQPHDLAAGYLFAIDTPSVTGAVIDIEGGALVA
ncbi:SDR family oxidoreductase (plasmid) [Leisingera sp. S132]|uniref:SDR family oxidoreductase n=1 Tax=Leisingera sp. S132 TaxID=2867016 RepID=UPI00147E6BCA|nr:SDR family oxidoreductase [Leisingera sp. S132]UWQ81492.1 SDR family oxidoreductase [Leisingera sp. S132]